MLVVHRVQVGQVVELGRRPQDRDLYRVHVVAALNVMAAAVGVRQIRVDPQLIRPAVRPFHAHGRPLVPVLVTDKCAIVVHVLARQIKRRAIGPTGDRHGVLNHVPRLVQLVGVIVGAQPRWQGRTPGATTDTIAWVVASTTRRRIGLHAEAALPIRPLQPYEMVHVVERRGRAQRETRRAGAAGLRRDQDDALARARAVDRTRSSAFHDLHVLDVVRVQVHRPVRDDGAFARVPAVVRVEARRRRCRIVDGHAVHHDERLVIPDERADAADLDE